MHTETKPLHPGVILKRDYIEGKSSITAFGDKCGMSRGMLSQICLGNRKISPIHAQRLATATDTTEVYWLNLQATHDAHVKSAAQSLS